MAPAAEDFSIVKVDGKPAVRVGLSGGRSVTVAPCKTIHAFKC